MAHTASATLEGMADTPQRPRMIFDCSEQLRRAVKFRAVKSGLSPSEVIARILESSLAREMAEAAESLAMPEEPPRTKRGRKPKSSD